MLSDRERFIVARIGEVMLTRTALGFSPDVLVELDDPDADSRRIEALKGHIGPDILSHLLAIAESVYFGSLKHGQVHNFYDAVVRLGTDRTKVYIVILALKRLARRDHEVETVFARSFATSVVGGVLAGCLSWREDVIRKVELGGLLVEIGRILILLYGRLYRREEGLIEETELSDPVVDYLHPHVGVAFLERFSLPPYLKEILLEEGLVLGHRHLTTAGVVHLAHDTVEASFRRSHGRLVATAPPRDEEGGFSLAEMIVEQFRAAGLSDHLLVLTPPG